MINSSYKLKIILLSAGKSERFEGIKLIARVEEHLHSVALIQHVLQQITSALAILDIDKSNFHVATGGYHQQISEVIGEECSIIHCPDAHLGLGHTIAQSVEKILCLGSNDETTKPSHIMITLADQVALTVGDYTRLIEQSLLMPDKLICAKADHDIMPPAIFPQKYFTQLLQLTGDKGAKALLHQNKKNLQGVSLPNAAIDIDTKQDLINWYKSETIHFK
ncbi:MAG: nucleotidyltransferase family protein [Colwellia sp.]|nr:nucleotidyltransferase family protein [Colwellia sp.]